MRKSLESKIISGAALFLLAGFGLACQPPSGNTVINTPNNANVTNLTAINANVTNANVNNVNTTVVSSGATIETKEPEQYQATVSLKFEASGANNVAAPPIKADVARNGADRRMEFVMPNGDKLIYLDRAGKQYVIAPGRRQYAELTKNALGFEVRSLLLPEQIVNQVKNIKGVERVGEENLDGRDVVKYRYGATTDTKSQAGTVNTESIILVDKETGLPLRSVTNSQSQNGNVQGVSGLNVVTEMSNIRPTADVALFELPQGFAMVEPERIRQTVDSVFSAALAIIGQMMKSAQPPPPTNTNQPM